MMQIPLCALAGILTGSLINWLADYLPRFAAEKPVRVTPVMECATLRVLVERHFTARAIVELLMAVMFVILGWRAGSLIDWLMPAIGVAFFLLIAVIDFKYRLVLNILILPALAIILVAQMVAPATNWLAVFIGGVFAFAIFAFTAWLRPGEIGGGDVKLVTLMGLWLGFPNVLWALLIGICAGGIVAIVLLKRPGWTLKSQMPYAPFLALGAIIALIYNPFASFIP